MLIDMFDKDRDGAINLNEFGDLFSYIKEWLNLFKKFDTNRSGNIEEGELNEAFGKMGYRLSNDFFKILLNKFDNESGKIITIDQFITICILIQNFTEEFKTKDIEKKGAITISYEDYLKILFNYIPFF